MMRNLRKLWAFLKRDFQSEVSYRLAFFFQVAGMFLSVLAFYFMTKMMDPNAKGLDGIPPFQWLLIGLSFQYYFSTALYAFASKIRNEQVLGTLEAMLVSPTPTGMVIFSSAGLGILSASFILYFKRGDPINFFLSGLTTMFGNVFFPSAQLPSGVQWISNILPITWSLKIVRGSLLQGQTAADLQGELLRLLVLTAVLLPAGIYFSRIAIRRAKREGSLVQY